MIPFFIPNLRIKRYPRLFLFATSWRSSSAMNGGLPPFTFMISQVETYAGLRPGFKGDGRKKHRREIVFP